MPDTLDPVALEAAIGAVKALGGGYSSLQVRVAIQAYLAATNPKPVEDKPITARQLADAFSCFNNAAINHAHRESVTSLAMDVATTLAEGFNAISARLEEDRK